MTRKHRIFTDQALASGQTVLLQGEGAHYLARVLRLAPGQEIVVFNGDGSDYAAEIGSFDRTAVQLRLGGRLRACAESPLRITLVQAVSRGERMDFSLQKATELGVSAIQPVFTERTEVRLSGDKLERRMHHWRKVIISACEQCGRACLPELCTPLEVLVWAQQESAEKRIVLVPGAAPLAGMSLDSAITLLIGPEGGLADRETEFMQRHGILPAGLGPRVLRTETAGPAAITTLQVMAGDLKG